jgi:hypothetical protein
MTPPLDEKWNNKANIVIEPREITNEAPQTQLPKPIPRHQQTPPMDLQFMSSFFPPTQKKDISEPKLVSVEVVSNPFDTTSHGKKDEGVEKKADVTETKPEATEKKPDTEENLEIIDLANITNFKAGPIKKLNYRQVDTTIQSSYYFECDNNSTVCDVIAMYLMGQKILYTEAKTYCEQHLNFLMLPAIFITAVCSILSLVLKDHDFGPIIVSSLNGVNAFILAVINYLKLDAKAEAHRVAAYKFDKLQSNLVFTSGKMLFWKEVGEKMKEIIQQTESDVRDIKETNQFLLPEPIRHRYPRIYSMNVFAEVKKINNREMLVINEVKDIMNEIITTKATMNKLYEEGKTKETCSELRDLVDKLNQLEIKQKKGIESYIELKDDYLKIDEEFEKELKQRRDKIRGSWSICGWLKT